MTTNDLFYCRYRPEPKGASKAQSDLQIMIDNYLARGWVITKRDPLTLYRGRAGYQLQNGVLVSV